MRARQNGSRPLKVLIAPDKFKGTLTATQAAEAIARGWHKARPGDVLTLLPISDGGDGFGEVLSRLVGAKPRKIKTQNSAHQPCMATWWWEPRTRTALLESASVVGLAMLPPWRYHPFSLDTFGLGTVIKAAVVAGAKHCLLGIGGSATNDGGFGMARALGWQFLDENSKVIERWTGLLQLAHIRPPEKPQQFPSLTVAVDVQNPLLGPQSGTRVYGPQKGLNKWDFVAAEKCLDRLATVVARDLGLDLADSAGAGAAGGLGFGLMAFCGARLERGFDIFAQHAALDRHLRETDLVITGEGNLDESSFMGKAVGEVARRCAKLGKTCIGMAGYVALKSPTNAHFYELHGLGNFAGPKAAFEKPSPSLEKMARLAAELYPG